LISTEVLKVIQWGMNKASIDDDRTELFLKKKI
jgi:hypothetical protein